MENLTKWKTYDIRLPENIMEKIRKNIESTEGLFEDEGDYITHCIINFHRGNRI